MIEYENLKKTNKFFLNKFKQEYKKFSSRGQYVLSEKVLNFEKNFSLDMLSINSETLNLISGHLIPRAVPQYLFWHDLGNPVDYSQISQDAIDLRKRVENYAKNH